MAIFQPYNDGLQNERIERRKREDHLIRAIVCFITIYCAMVLTVMTVTTFDSDMKTIPEWMHGLTLYVAMSCSTVNSLVYSVLIQKMKTSFLNIVGKCFRTINQSMTENTKDHSVY